MKNIKKSEPLNIRIVLDRSGSMAGSKEITIQALNTYLEDLKKENERPGYITLSTFDSMSIDIPITKTSLEEITYFSNDILQPRGGTPLFDTIGIAMHDLENIGESSDNSKVLVIVTDGLENASKEYSYDDVRKKIEEKEEAGWLIIYLGADHDAFHQSTSLGFNSVRSMKYSKEDSIDAFKAVSRTTSEYRKGTKNKTIQFTEEERISSDKLNNKDDE